MTVCVTDNDGASTCDTLEVTVLGPIDLKEGTIEQLSMYTAESDRFEKAIKEIQQSLESDLWMDLIHLDDKEGHEVSSEERQAVKELMEALEKSDKDSGKDKHVLSDEARIAAQMAIETLVHDD